MADKISKPLQEYIAVVLKEKRNYKKKGRHPYRLFLDNELTLRFTMLRLISSGIPLVREQLVKSGAVSSEVLSFVFCDVRQCSYANECLVKLLISLAENCQLMDPLVTPPLVLELLREQKACLLKSYLSCLLLLSKNFSSRLREISKCSEEEFASKAVCFPLPQRILGRFPESNVEYAKKTFSLTSLSEMSQLSLAAVVQFAKKCLKVLEQ